MQSKIEGFLEVVSSKKRFNDREFKLITSDHRSSYPLHCSLKMLGTNTSTYYLEIRKAISYLIVYKKKKNTQNLSANPTPSVSEVAKK